ncbi:hypothetical protein [Microlunatus sp. GCM10028923]|uniref:hypothetical protein n=1 Tax=Microlunatus sp. GCM10028923 TaxID=3273400 RepID=UPI0036165DEB
MVRNEPPDPRRRWTRRAALGLGLAGAGAVIGSPPATAAGVSLGRFTFDVQSSIRPQDPPSAGWQWQGQLIEDNVASILILARADLTGTEPQEALGLLLASGIGGWLPELTTGPARARATQDGSPGLRSPIGFRPEPGRRYRGTVLITSNGGSTAILAVLGTDRLTAGRIDQVLDSARWSS